MRSSNIIDASGVTEVGTNSFEVDISDSAALLLHGIESELEP